MQGSKLQGLALTARRGKDKIGSLLVYPPEYYIALRMRTAKKITRHLATVTSRNQAPPRNVKPLHLSSVRGTGLVQGGSCNWKPTCSKELSKVDSFFLVSTLQTFVGTLPCANHACGVTWENKRHRNNPNKHSRHG